ADDARGLLVGAAGGVALLVHPVEDAAVHRLEAVADVRKGAADDDRHRIVEIRLAHLVFDVDRQLLIDEVCVIEFGHCSYIVIPSVSEGPGRAGGAPPTAPVPSLRSG